VTAGNGSNYTGRRHTKGGAGTPGRGGSNKRHVKGQVRDPISKAFKRYEAEMREQKSRPRFRADLRDFMAREEQWER
jgi:hypothetical protein